MNAPPGQGNFSFERKVGFIEITAMRHRRGELNIVNDVIGPGEGLLDSGGIDGYRLYRSVGGSRQAKL